MYQLHHQLRSHAPGLDYNLLAVTKGFLQLSTKISTSQKLLYTYVQYQLQLFLVYNVIIQCNLDYPDRVYPEP